MIKANTFPYSLGCRKDPPDRRDILLGNYLIPRVLPRTIDWADIRVPILEQEGPSCVGYSAARLKIVHELREYNKLIRFNGLKLYKRCKEKDGIPDLPGTYIRIVMKILQQEGAEFEGKYYKIESYTRLTTINEMRFSLASVGPILAGVQVTKEWENNEAEFIKFIKESSSLGGHAILVTGYDDNIQAFNFANSWGLGWSKNGRAWLSYNYIAQHLHSAWAAPDLTDPKLDYILIKQKFLSDLEKSKK